MSRLRRLVVSDRYFFITCRVLARRDLLSVPEFAGLARVIHERREEHKFLLTAWVVLPDHWHAIFYPPYPLTISRVMESIKGAATKRINRRRRECGTLFQARFFDRALRTVRECHEKVEYIHLQPGEGRFRRSLGGLAVVERARLHGHDQPGTDYTQRPLR
jgi:putative transposase